MRPIPERPPCSCRLPSRPLQPLRLIGCLAGCQHARRRPRALRVGGSADIPRPVDGDRWQAIRVPQVLMSLQPCGCPSAARQQRRQLVYWWQAELSACVRQPPRTAGVHRMRPLRVDDEATLVVIRRRRSVHGSHGVSDVAVMATDSTLTSLLRVFGAGVLRPHAAPPPRDSVSRSASIAHRLVRLHLRVSPRASYYVTLTC